jgi:transcriptional regulator with XRE-family HTH domain
MSGMGQRVSELRQARGFTRAELARLVDVSQPAVYNWEETDTRPRQAAMTTLCRVLGTTEEYLLTGRQAPAATAPVRTVEQILADATREIAAVLAMPTNRVQVRFEVN